MALEQSFSQAGVIPINTVLIGPIDADKMRGLSFHCVSMGTTGVAKVQGSADGVNGWTDISHFDISAAAAPAVSFNAAKAGWCNLVLRYFRIILTTATTAGTTTIHTRATVGELSELPGAIAIASLPAIPAGTNLIGKSIVDVSATVANGPTLLINRLLSAAATTNPVSVKASAGRIIKIRGHNAKASVVYLKLYNKASAPTVGTDTPVLTIPLKASDVFDIDFEDFGLQFSTGIAFALTGGVADADTTALVAGDILGMGLIYI